MELEPLSREEKTSNAISSGSNLLSKFKAVRNLTESICEPLEVEDFVAQPVTDVSPPKWHLAHTSWFFEELILKKYKEGYKVYDDIYSFLFNSYYEAVGECTLRPDRGNMTRPTVEQVLKYRVHVNNFMEEFLEGPELNKSIVELIILGLNHEQQHQELLLTDLKYILGHNPLFPAYRDSEITAKAGMVTDPAMEWLTVQQGIYEIGFDGDGFHFDNEKGRHKAFIHDFRIMDRLVTNGEFLEFMDSGGYENFKWWLSEGWDWVNRLETKSPLYWHKIDGKWMNYTLSGLKEVNPYEPLTHISMYEADAYAQWKGLRLPTEYEWEVVASKFSNPLEKGNFVQNGSLHPLEKMEGNTQFLGDVWEWTNSAYLPYPFFKTAEGAVGEYNGKFMINQKVLRGGSCVTSRDHIRLTYRNFFHPHLRWQFNGLRLAETLK